MERIDLEELVRRHQAEGGLERVILERIAKDVYGNPARYGFRQEEDVGEAFSRYWSRILGLLARYRPGGPGFDAYLATAFRYFALSIRRDGVIDYDRETVTGREEALLDGCGSSEAHEPPAVPVGTAFPPVARLREASGKAFRTRIGYLCAKCAHLLDDDRVTAIATAVGVDPEELLAMTALVRSRTVAERARFMSRRRGRDAAWLRMSVNARRLQRTTDPEARAELSARLERDRRLYRVAVADMKKARSVVPNRVVARILGVSKATVDSGVTRILRQCRSLYADGAEGLPG